MPKRDSLDNLVRRYFMLQGRGLDIVDSRGFLYDERCSRVFRDKTKCASRLSVWKDTEQRWVCGRCGESWPLHEAFVLKRVVQRSPRAGEVEARMAELAELGHALNAMLRDSFWRWETQVLVGYALTPATYADIAMHARVYGWKSRSGRDWSEAMAKQGAQRARRELTRRIAAQVFDSADESD